MIFRLFLCGVLMCAVPAVPQYTVDTIPDISQVYTAAMVDNALYISCKDDGDKGSVSVVRNGVKAKLWPGIFSINGPRDFTLMNDHVYYCFNDNTDSALAGPGRLSLWRTDGTNCQKITGDKVGEPVVLGDNIYFRKYDPATGYELWKYNDSTGVSLVADIEPGAASSYPGCITVFKNQIVFAAYNSFYGFEMWVSDGTPGGTHLLKDIRPGPQGAFLSGTVTIDSHTYRILAAEYKYACCNNRFFFLANDNVHGLELWCSDGTEPGTYMVKDINAGGSSSFDRTMPKVPLFTVFNDELYFIPESIIYGNELWKTDGTASGTYMLKDINPDTADAGITEFEAYNGFLYFDADDGTHGKELWRTDGTPGGTTLFLDLQPQISYGISSNPRDLTTHVDGNLYFIYKNVEPDTFCDDFGTCVPYGFISSHLYRTDGTIAGTEKILDFPVDEIHSNAHMLASSNMGLYFKRKSSEERLCWLRTASPLLFTSTPVTNAVTGNGYIYDIGVTGTNGLPVIIQALTLPSWLTFQSNGDSTARLYGTPPAEGDFNVVVRAFISGADTITQTFTVYVRNPVSIDSNLVIYSYEEQRSDPNQSNPRIYIKNTGTTPVSNFKVEYYFLVENGKIPVLEPYYPGDCSVFLVSIDSGWYKIVYNYTGKTIAPGQILPGPSGSVVGIHHYDYSPWNKANDYSNNLSSVFVENNHICIFSQAGTLIYGIPPYGNLPPVASAGSSRTILDSEGDGENVVLDGSTSYDPDGIIVNYEWFVNGNLAATGRTGAVTLFPGVNTVWLRVTDDDGAVSADTITITVLDMATAVSFTISQSPVPPNTPIIIQHTVPPALHGATIIYTLQRSWDVINGILAGAQGSYISQFWEWNKYFFGGSGPWQVNFFVNGVLVETKQIRFSY